MKLKIAFLTFGHVDVSLPFIAELDKINDFDYKFILCFAQNKKSESVIDFHNINVPNGFLNESWNKFLIPNELITCYGFLEKSNFFIFNNLKLKSISNFFLALRLIRQTYGCSVVHISGEDAILPLLLFLFKIQRKKIIFTLHDYIPHTGEKLSISNLDSARAS